MTFVQMMMTITGVCYALVAVGLWVEQKPWMAVTFMLYAGTAFTLYMAGRTAS